MNKQSFFAKFQGAIQYDGPLDLSNSFTEIPHWDSMMIVSVIVLLSNEYNVTLSADEFRSCGTIEDLYSIVESKAGN